MSDVTLDMFDAWLKDDEFAAITAHQLLQSVEGAEGVIFPPTYAATTEGQKGNYNIDYFEGEFQAKVSYRNQNQEKIESDIRHEKGGNVCLINSVGAEANRVEPLFKPEKKDGKYASLVPQVLIEVRNKTDEVVAEINLLDAGHRAGDAIVRFTPHGVTVFEAFKEYLDNGNALQLAKIAPTSIVFGVWDSRGTQAKLPRVFRSIVRAYNVRPLKRSAQFNRAMKYVENGVIDEKLDKGEGDKNPLSREGFKDNPATGAPGGVIVDGDIRRDITINLSAIRRLQAPNSQNPKQTDADQALKLRRYILGLSLVAATARTQDKFDLREGCQLRVKPGFTMGWNLVPFEGTDQALSYLTGELSLAYAKAAADSFVVGGPYPPVRFDQKTAEKWLELDKKAQDKLRREKPMTK
ncbi:MAG TPA: type I-U CRISPR-associated RAMP protein Csb1/Cas7u [Gemmataceae bacterium]|nr:type I-U CRISPR-associated RAMP protein Csb1/Cas7u [Gemmataceae bacterium]